MNIGPLTLANPVILAPMAGISNLPYRRLMKRFGAALVFTEMVSANGLRQGGRGSLELLASAPEERPLAIQIFGADPECMGEAARTVSPYGDLVDINLGCPVRKVIGSGAGSALLRSPGRVAAIVAAVRRATPLPVTVKLRSGWDSDSINFLDVARAAVEQGADAVTLHPRTRAQMFGGEADWEQIGRLKQVLSVPVIGSGDIWRAEDALRMLRETGCDAVMLGRGAMGNPWLIRDILTLRAGGNPVKPPDAAERLETIRTHLALFLESFPPSLAVREMRKHLGWYVRGLPGAAAFRATLNHIASDAELHAHLDAFFARQLESAA